MSKQNPFQYKVRKLWLQAKNKKKLCVISKLQFFPLKMSTKILFQYSVRWLQAIEEEEARNPLSHVILPFTLLINIWPISIFYP